MDSLITAAARALAAGDPLAALKRVALRDDPPALALRGIAMAQLGDLARAKELLRSAARGFGPIEATARARCVVAEAEIALVSRDLSGPMHLLRAARATLEAHGDRVNAAHAGYLEARRLLLIGWLDEAEQTLDALDGDALPPASRTGYWLVAAGIAMRRIRAGPARVALDRAGHAAHATGIAALTAEVDRASRMLFAPCARLIARGEKRLVGLGEVEALIASDALVVDACRNVVRGGPHAVPLAGLHATDRGFVLQPHRAPAVAVLAPPVEGEHAEVLARLADGVAWSSSALALALDVSPRTVQRALEALAEDGKVESFGRGRACRWMVPNLPGFPTSLLLLAPLTSR